MEAGSPLGGPTKPSDFGRRALQRGNRAAMAYESLQKKLNRVRAPHVHITYDVEVGDAIEKRELPFVLGVMADLSGKPQEPLPPLRDRRFVEINRDNFDQLVRTVRPNVRFKVANTLAQDDSQLAIELSF